MTLIKAKTLSLRYNAWTTEVRSRHPHINPPPTVAARARNTTIMTWLFRTLGLWMTLIAAGALLLAAASK